MGSINLAEIGSTANVIDYFSSKCYAEFMSTKENHEQNCPLAAVHKRLEDLHRQWHQAEAAYFDPEGFRVAIQTAIQTSRTVTFILQSNKRSIPKFDDWYGIWQERFKSMPVMKWMVEARNRIEKRGDLDTHSYIKADIVASYLVEGPTVQVPAKLWDAPLKLWKSVPANDLGKHIQKDGFLRIQRRWIENTLPEFELLEAVSIAYGHLSQMLSDAHQQMGLEEPTTINQVTGERYDNEAMHGRMPCMIAHSDLRTLNIWLASGQPMKIDVVDKHVDTSEHTAKKLLARYDLPPKEIFSASDVAGDQFKALFSTARKMLLKDGYHITVMFLLKGAKPIKIISMQPEEHGEKYLMMKSVATIAQQKGADGAILIGEVWRSRYDSASPYRRAVDAPDKEEALQGTLVTKDSYPQTDYSDNNSTCENQILLGDSVEMECGAQYMFAPLYEVWGRPIPQEWLSMNGEGEEK